MTSLPSFALQIFSSCSVILDKLEDDKSPTINSFNNGATAVGSIKAMVEAAAVAALKTPLEIVCSVAPTKVSARDDIMVLWFSLAIKPGSMLELNTREIHENAESVKDL